MLSTSLVLKVMLGASALGQPRGMVWGGRREEGSGWGTHVFLWQIHSDNWQNQYNIVKLNKIKFKKIKNKVYNYNMININNTTFCYISLKLLITRERFFSFILYL